MLKTLHHADYYEHLNASSATWPLWPNLKPNSNLKGHTFKSPDSELSGAKHDHPTFFLLDLYLYLPTIVMK